ncbi:MAG: hypothetical protein EAZ91_16335 [Cytophagales bacterium]|nr:MAG: hypothetical protein EAZ91_16335 [Cytophagales bacterium]
MRLFLPLLTLLCGLLCVRCTDNPARFATANPQGKPTAVVFDGTSYRLLRHGKPYFIEGAGGVSHLDRLQTCGGNSIRIWDDADADQLLDEAHRLGLTVMLGLWVEREMEGFSYDNQAAVARQYKRIRKTVLKYRNHPALLLWCVGNEWAQGANNVKVYDEVNRLATLVHDLDPNHPVSTAISPDSKRAVWLVAERCPAVDILSVNAYALTDQLGEFFQKGGWNGPYIISEYGAQAYWETPTAPWGAPDEPNSEQKRAFVHQFYPKHIGSRPANCLGAYLFYWGTKQEESHTWFSVFDEQGRETPLVEQMQELWGGGKPTNRSPVLQTILIDGKPALRQVFRASDKPHQVQVLAQDPDGDSLTYAWEIKLRAARTADYVGTPRPPVAGLFQNSATSTTEFRLPRQPGAYRLFVYVYDNHNHVATANVSFMVQSHPEFQDNVRE